MSITVLVRVASSLSVQGKSNHFWTNSLMMVLLSQQEIDVNVNREDFIASDVTSCDYLDDSSISITVCCDAEIALRCLFRAMGIYGLRRKADIAFLVFYNDDDSLSCPPRC
jgi:hypothetical protein